MAGDDGVGGDGLTGALAATPLGEALAADDLARLAAAGRVHEAAAGEVLRREGEAGGTLFVLLSGEVEVVKVNGGEERRLTELGPGALLGEIGFLCGEAATATLRTRAPSRLFELPREVFLDLAAREDPAVMRLALALARVLARRLARMNERAFELCEEQARELERAGVPAASARVRDLAAFRAQLGALKF
ncbi:MAG TPA: cyclic nucleotide-binding domain-containing protein [Thermoanaerobaculia bacterium]|nr:cyclic nucleotide-binding domain-containing protein [Thermoanaerobaculia bacterium]